MPRPSDLMLLRKIEETAEHVAEYPPSDWTFWIWEFVNHVADSGNHHLIEGKKRGRRALWEKISDKLEAERS